ncbi:MULTISPECIES: hypothetical protein [unclassified Mesorhizobium]|uniref:hypothetical protein n=1 Tax=unclassified Mesorhizobium TaxID=325217 RepID=UPI000FCC44CC|nr:MULTISPECIES: hypothetical protein [unclassified Mesorhizobium]RUV95464.1 hypothetical protein EOA49_27545 [Mesorhizobium sp. M1A.F.Ca.IN.020.04.1.1]RUW13045.1 hypothetical protein EOA53_09305 [Mesorhizobium sp. M1A.F.Ca.IN.020.03.1.1]RWF75526.1 MAG: hypothetical protein EOQ34_01825 [Mesorhizobium sp.]RWG16754.1 MAG: hypothetical protein EOQ58_07495 [Mesorhizobium sp.]RWG33472.1 MAG: hypothetical protein EOQ61_08515 [Mesorhizobium sp.]
MGNPQNFSIDVPRRCLILLEQLWPSVSNKADERLLPLNASFLLAISTPMVNLPIERIWKPQKGRAVGHLNDSVLDASLAKAVKVDIGQSPVAKAPFYKAGAWRYHYLPKGPALPDLSKQGLPLGVQQALVADAALTAADALATETFCSVLRNGLAHGGILYLDSHGQTTEGAPVTRFCFVSTKQKNQAILGLHFLQITMKDYRAFLGKWVGWLQNATAKPNRKKTQ